MTHQPMNVYPVKFDVFRRRAEVRMHPGGSFPAAFASVMCLQNASISGADESPVLAGVAGSLGIVGSSHEMRQLFAPMGESEQQDVL